jgi:toxin-antitoxin system PIN domain toxin
MIAFDTNFLVYAHRGEVPQHAIANRLLARVLEDERPWALPWPCAHEFFSIVTNTRMWAQPTTPLQAWSVIKDLLRLPGANVIGEGVNHLDILERFIRSGQVRGGMIHDARVAAICIANGINEIWTADRDFSRFPELKTYNPFQDIHGRHRH